MATQTIYFKEHEGLVPNNSIGQLSSIPSGHWWGSAFGSQSIYEGSCGQLKPLSIEQPGSRGGGGNQFTAIKQLAGRGTDLGLDKGNSTQFTIFPGDCKYSGDSHKSEAAISLQSSLPEYHARFELGFGQPMVCAKYPYVDQYCGVISYGHQLSGRIMLPLNLTADDGPIYVNAKQYHGIIRRRQSRAKAAVLLSKINKARKPYMHESRHLHAMRRPRGCGGRFLNTKNMNKENNKEGSPEAKKLGTGQQLSPPSRSLSSEALESESVTLNSSKEANNSSGSNISGSEVTSMYTRGDLDHHFQVSHHLGAVSLHPFAGMMDIMPGKWMAAADPGCCNIKV